MQTSDFPKNTPTLVTNRLILRRFTSDDVQAIFEIMSDPQVNTFLPLFPLKTMEEAMEHLKSIGTVVYLKLSLNALSKRLGNLKGRGVLLREGQTLTNLYEERTPLYEKYADIVIDEEGKDLEASLEILLKTLKEK